MLKVISWLMRWVEAIDDWFDPDWRRDQDERR
jgi:hypothetical protein